MFYDVTKPQSLHSLKDYYASIINLSMSKEWPHIPRFIIVANKVDKAPTSWMPEEDAHWIGKNLSPFLAILPVSCKTKEGISMTAQIIVLTSCGLMDTI
uniref:Uncharacterized protein n=1 Tax=Arcella intermedia TaxID=1963864 RepID=A0A6B2LQZ1_9EUKA